MTSEPNNVNCLNSRAIIEYIRRHYPDQTSGAVSAVCRRPSVRCRSSEDYLCDENNWVPSSLVVKMFENAKRITGNPEVAFSIGFESITHWDLGYAQRIFVTYFASPRAVLRQEPNG